MFKPICSADARQKQLLLCFNQTICGYFGLIGEATKDWSQINFLQKKETDSKLLASPLATSLQAHHIIQYGATFVLNMFIGINYSINSGAITFRF